MIYREFRRHKHKTAYLQSQLIENEEKWAVVFCILTDEENTVGTFLTQNLRICLDCINRFRCKVLKL